MSTKQYTLSLGSILILALPISPCAAQIIYVRDAAGYVRPVVIPSANIFSMGMQTQGVVGGDGTFAMVNVTPTAFSIMDPSTNIPMLVPGPNLGIFDGGKPQPAFISLKAQVLGVQGGQQGVFGQMSFAGQTLSPPNALGQFQSNPFTIMSMQSNVGMPNMPLQSGAGPLINPNLAIRLQSNRVNPLLRNPNAL